MKTLRTAPQILEHYMKQYGFDVVETESMKTAIKAMRHYARIKSDIAYEKGYQSAINQMK